jgi:hypothetical protein
MGVRSEQFLDGGADAHFGESGPGYDRDPLDQNLPDNVSRVNPQPSMADVNPMNAARSGWFPLLARSLVSTRPLREPFLSSPSPER